MSLNQWESGTFHLPAAEFSRVRKAVETAEHARAQRLFDNSQEFWKSLTAKQKRDTASFQEAARDFANAKYARSPSHPWSVLTSGDDAAVKSEQLEDYLLSRSWSKGKPARVLRTVAGFPTNRTTAFSEGDLSVAFDRESASLIWHIAENNHSVDLGNRTELARVVMRELRKVKWTRGTGGTIYGGDEYAEDAYRSSGQPYSDRCRFAIGPMGAKKEPFACTDYVDSTGKLVRSPDIIQAAFGGARQGRVTRGVPTGGQFTGRRRGEGGARLT